jgi:hypothetical protein
VKNGSEKFFSRSIDRFRKKLKLANKLIIQMNIYLKCLIDALRSDLQKICNVKKYWVRRIPILSLASFSLSTTRSQKFPGRFRRSGKEKKRNSLAIWKTSFVIPGQSGIRINVKRTVFKHVDSHLHGNDRLSFQNAKLLRKFDQFDYFADY